MDTRRIILRLVAGGYVLYLGYQLLSNYFKGMNSGNPIVSIVGGVLFVIFGLWSLLSVLIPMFKNGGFVPPVSDGDSEDVIDEDTEEVSEEMIDTPEESDSDKE